MSGSIKNIGIAVALCLFLTTAVPADIDNHVWNTFGEGVATNIVTALTFEGDLVVAGYASKVGDDTLAVVSRWDGENWNVMGGGTTHWVSDLVEYNGQLIAVCEPFIYQETDPDTITAVVGWSGSAWTDLGFGKYGDFNAALVWDNKLIVAGHFDTAAGLPARSVAAWDGNSWSALGVGLTGRVYALAEYGGDLIAAGYISATGDGTPIYNIARWDGVSWQQMGDGLSREVGALLIYNGQLIAGGRSSESGAVHVGSVAAWDGSSWSGVGGGIDLFDVDALTEFQGNLFVVGSGNRFRRFDGDSWLSALSVWGDTYEAMVYDGKLIIGGRLLSEISGLSLGNVAWRSSFDQDADGVIDLNDNCIWAANPDQANADGDLIGDACDDCYGCEKSVYLHHVDGLKNSDTIYAGTPVRFYFAVSGFPEDSLGAISLGFNLNSPDGASWAIPELDTARLGWNVPQYFGLYFPTSDLTGSESDLLGLAAMSLTGSIFPEGFHEVTLYIETEFDSDQEGLTFCIDSTSIDPVGNWAISAGHSSSIAPYWDGPHCFTIQNCCMGATVGDIDLSGIVDIADIQVMIDNQFLTLAPLPCFSQGDVDLNGDLDITDLSILIDNQFLSLTPLPPCP